MVGEQIGFDEGGVFQALSDPVFTRTTTKYRHNKDGLVTSEITTVINLTGAHILAAALGPALLALIAKVGDLDDDTVAGLLAGSPFGLAGMAIGAVAVQDVDVPKVGGESKSFIQKLIETMTGGKIPGFW